MSGSFFDNAGGLQSVPDVTVKEVEGQSYVTEAGSMQSALAVNVVGGNVPSDGAIVEDGDRVDVEGEPVGTLAVADGAVTGVALDSTAAIVEDGDRVDVEGEPVGTLAVADGAVTGVALDSTAAIVEDGGAVPVVDSEGGNTHVGNLSVAGGSVTGVALGIGAAMVDDGQAVQVAVTGDYVDTVTFSVVDGAITGIELS